MGFPAGYTDVDIPKILLGFFYLLGFLRNLIFSFFGFLGLYHLVEYEVPSSDRTWQPEEYKSLSAMLLREILPVVKLSADNRVMMDSCIICLCEFEDGAEIRALRNCKHAFHGSCLDRWMDCDRQTCPLCRSHLVPDEMRDAFKERLWAAEEALFYSDADDDWNALPQGASS